MNKDNLMYTIAKNEMLPCSVTGCPYHRHRLYSVCIKHEANKSHWGHPKARAIQKQELKAVLTEVKELVERHEATHQGLQNALNWFDRWLKDAAENKRGVHGSKHIRRLAEHGVSAHELLITCGAVWLFSYRFPHRLPSEDALTYAISHQVMKLVPLEYATTSTGKKRALLLSKKDRKEIGSYIRRSLGMLFVRMVQSIDERVEKDRAFTNEMCRKFD
jgi:hypothetical protein